MGYLHIFEHQQHAAVVTGGQLGGKLVEIKHKAIKTILERVRDANDLGFLGSVKLKFVLYALDTFSHGLLPLCLFQYSLAK